ncbi:TPA: hypothetical protein PC505_000978 [Morganella morganii]|nr:hypothetical protein [Morganella morganii]HDF2421609.1 hypothetical protein [Morganella morganii]
MKTIKLSEGDMARFESAMHASEEIIALLLPVLTAVENEAEPDTHLMVRAIKRIAVEQHGKLRGLAEVMK